MCDCARDLEGRSAQAPVLCGGSVFPVLVLLSEFFALLSLLFVAVVNYSDRRTSGSLVCSWFKVAGHGSQEATEAEAWAVVPSHPKQEAHSDEYLCSTRFLLFVQSRIAAQGMVPPTVGRSSHIN